MSSDDEAITGLTFAVNHLQGPCKLLIVANLLNGPQPVHALYQSVPTHNWRQFISQLISLWYNGLVKLSVSRSCQVSCRLTQTGQSLRRLMDAMDRWGTMRTVN
ncbi:winged helix-turn-helix transcriptional regulator [Furfurilactobacillus sp. WILCCON 0119]